MSGLRPQGPDLQNNRCSTTMAPQVSDEMRARIIIWHNEKHLCVQEIAELAGVLDTDFRRQTLKVMEIFKWRSWSVS